MKMDRGDFFEHLARRLSSDEDVLESLNSIVVDEFFLAFACAYGNENAQAHFIESYDQVIDKALLRFRKQNVSIEDVKHQILAYFLFPRKSLPPAISNYSGSGSLAGYLRISVLNEAVRFVKKGQKEIATDKMEEFDPTALTSKDPAIEALKQQYRTEFKEAFQEAIKALENKDVILLRLHYVSGLKMREIGALQNRGKSAVSRAIVQVREKLFRMTHERLMERIGVGKTEVHSIIRMVKSQLDVSFERILKNKK